MSRFVRTFKRKQWKQDRKRAQKRIRARQRLVEGLREAGQRAPRV